MPVQFEDNFKSRKILGNPVKPGMVGFLVKKGIAKNEKQAGIILITVLITTLLASLFFISNTFNLIGGTSDAEVDRSSDRTVTDLPKLR